ncbi:MAG: class I SAM-dependent methyltransferase [Chloroflexi bacterium]|nr:class I SAM-dependent methyltransferase [Chloroflexota bacterium]
MLTLVPEAIERYAVAHTAPLDPLLEELIATTRREFGGLAAMLSGPIEGTLLQTLVAVGGARRVLEIGTFTGFSALMMAAALPDDGELITCDVNPRHLAVARAFFARSPHGHKITVREGPALDTLRTLAGPFDLVFIDADKEAYPAYYEAVLPLLAPRGVIVVDNVLRGGRVLAPENAGDHAIVTFNAQVARDPRVRPVLLPLRDGVLLIRRA